MTGIINRIKKIFLKYREQWLYLFFGVLTTAVNYLAFWLLERAWHGRHVLEANLIAFVAATLFAFVTNKLFVFESKSMEPPVLFRELLTFLSARVFSFGIEEGGLFVAAYVLKLGRYQLAGLDGIMISKIFLSVIVVVVNYLFSKFLIFANVKDDKAVKQR